MRRRTSWSTFLKAHWESIAATDFFTVEVVTIAIWSDVEMQLIYHFQPALNTGSKKTDRSRRPVLVSVKNYVRAESFDDAIYPHRHVGEEEWDCFF